MHSVWKANIHDDDDDYDEAEDDVCAFANRNTRFSYILCDTIRWRLHNTLQAQRSEIYSRDSKRDFVYKVSLRDLINLWGDGYLVRFLSRTLSLTLYASFYAKFSYIDAKSSRLICTDL